MAWFIREADGSQTLLPPCSAEYQPTFVWHCCLMDPVKPICRAHRRFFKSRKVAP